VSRVYQPMRGSSPISASKSGRKLNYWGIEAVLPALPAAYSALPVGSRKILQNQVYVYLVAYHLHHHRLPIKNPGNPWLYAAALRPDFIPRWIARSNLAPRLSNRVSRSREVDASRRMQRETTAYQRRTAFGRGSSRLPRLVSPCLGKIWEKKGKKIRRIKNDTLLGSA